MAKAKKTTQKAKKTTPKLKIASSSLVAITKTNSKVGTITAKYTKGNGQITAILYRNGIGINQQTISNDGNIMFSDVQPGDAIAINGICTGGATISIDIPTLPESPLIFNSQHILSGFSII